MKITFYKQYAEPYRVDKDEFLSAVVAIDNVFMTSSSSLINPSFILSTKQDVYNSNYLFCDFTNMYYYINEVIALTGGRIQLNCHVDVLYTFKNEIYNSPAWVLKSGFTDDNSKLMHNDFPFQQNYKILGRDIQSADNPFAFAVSGNERNVILIIK